MKLLELHLRTNLHIQRFFWEQDFTDIDLDTDKTRDALEKLVDEVNIKSKEKERDNVTDQAKGAVIETSSISNNTMQEALENYQRTKGLPSDPSLLNLPALDANKERSV